MIRHLKMVLYGNNISAILTTCKQYKDTNFILVYLKVQRAIHNFREGLTRTFTIFHILPEICRNNPWQKPSIANPTVLTTLQMPTLPRCFLVFITSTNFYYIFSYMINAFLILRSTSYLFRPVPDTLFNHTHTILHFFKTMQIVPS
jgi:hypothetical protein